MTLRVTLRGGEEDADGRERARTGGTGALPGGASGGGGARAAGGGWGATAGGPRGMPGAMIFLPRLGALARETSPCRRTRRGWRLPRGPA